MNHACKDHLGKEYKNVKEMCKAWNVPYRTFHKRQVHNWSLEESLKGRSFQDHLGTTYSTKAEMCKAWGVTPNTYDKRIRIGWSIEDALTKDIRKVETYRDHLGREYESRSAMCSAWNVKIWTYDKRLRSGWSQREALTGERPVVGQKFYGYLIKSKVYEDGDNTYYAAEKDGYEDILTAEEMIAFSHAG